MKRAAQRFLRLAAGMCAVLLAGLLTVPAHADVSTTEELTGGAGTVYVAGNPALYPLEFYNPSTGCYEGIVPQILEYISNETGLDFCYVSAGPDNVQHRLAKNKQVELLTAYIPDSETALYLSGTQLILTAAAEDGTIDVCIAFTEIASPSLIELITQALHSLSNEKLSDMVISYTIGKEIPKNQKPILWGLVAGLGLAVVCIILLISSMIRRARRQRDDALTDKSTSIGNKEYFLQYYNTVLTDHNRSLYYVAYLAFDIRWVNQYMGVDETEQILRHAADTLMNYTGDNDIAARIAGGSFALAYQCGNLELAEEHLQELLNRLSRDNEEEKAEFQAGLFPIGSGNYTCETAVSNAEKGYHRAHQENLSYVVCTPSLLKELDLEQQIQEQTADAVKNGEFKPYLQFMVDGKTQQICGAEMLSRWQNPKSGLLTPARYISIMEQAGTIVELDFYIFEQACRQLEYWAQTGREQLFISCNFSRLTISRDDFCQKLFDIASRFSFARSCFVLEITEDIMESDKQAALRNARSCKEFGFRLALDDMGNGYTSFLNLCDYPIDIIKVDRSIIVNSVLLTRGPILLNAIVTMAHKMSMIVVCEGVETDEQDAMVRETGANYIQGYRYSRVLPIEEADGFMRKYRLSPAERIHPFEAR